jgi:hypothetical protein
MRISAAPIGITTPAPPQHQRRREHRPVRDTADDIMHLVVPRFTGEPRAGQPMERLNMDQTDVPDNGTDETET